jgi:hypothetical protein
VADRPDGAHERVRPLASRPEPACGRDRGDRHGARFLLKCEWIVYGGSTSNGKRLGDVWLLTPSLTMPRATCTDLPDTSLIAASARSALRTHDGVRSRRGARGVQLSPPVGGLPRMYYPKMYVFGGKRNAQTWAGTDTVWVLELWGSYAWHPWY